MKGKIWNVDMECMDPHKIKELQENRFLSLINLAYKKTQFYRKKFDDADLSLSDIRSLKDIVKIPFTYKDDLRVSQERMPPYGEHCVAPEKIRQTYWSTGTTGRPTIMGVSNKEALYWNDVIARMIVACGGREGDLLHHATQLSGFPGGYVFLRAAQLIGTNIIPAGAGNTERHLWLISTLKPRFLKILPSYANYMAEVGYKMGIDMRASSVEVIHLSAEPSPPVLRRELEHKWGALTYDNYGLSDIGQPQAYECELRNGLHNIPDWSLTEIIDPETNEPIEEEGKEGVLVFTNLVRKTLPIIRFWTNNPSSWKSYQPCDCGRTTARIEPVSRRLDDMIKVKGVNFWPSAIWTVLEEWPELTGMHRVLVETRSGKDYLKITAEVKREAQIEKQRLISALKKRLQSALFIKVDEMEIVPSGTLKITEHKEKTVIDLRKDKAVL
ncbi:phenylacetate--CoA ligase family protein [Thermodesulfobacteriota bacterium]